MTTLTQPISLPQSTFARLGRVERAAARLGIVLLRWASRRAAEPLTHEERARRLATIEGVRAREHAMARHLPPR